MNEITNLLIAVHRGEMKMTDRQFANRYRGQAKKIKNGVQAFEQVLETERKKLMK